MPVSISFAQLKWWRAGDDIRTASERIVGKVFEAIIDGIQRNNVYKLRVMGINRGGDGKNSPTVYFTLGGEVAFDAETAEQVLVGYDGGERQCPRIFSIALVVLCGLVAV
ncbi:hypothetical protein CHS0354_020657 [Potamilus streckersoni]|uniref:Fibronectin type-III domain-containing protein n=1 Tax=Potamilus streckersoni TaxID=2493646 RepID=A0AAE0SRK7_9BIVA|nr:hypothetical protein CHS0354_020657 [Potamilus streckersoni]